MNNEERVVTENRIQKISEDEVTVSTTKRSLNNSVEKGFYVNDIISCPHDGSLYLLRTVFITKIKDASTEQ